MRSWSTTLLQCLSGMILLALVAFVGTYLGAVVTAYTFGALGGIGLFLSSGSLFVAAGILLVIGLALEGRGGFALAPAAFFGVWLGVSVVARLIVAGEAVALGPPPSIDPKFATHRTLVIDAYPPLPRTFVTEGIIDRLVEITYKNNDPAQPIENIRQTTLARAADCTEEDNEQSLMLHQIGRIDECLKSVDLTAVPDGLHILHPPRAFRQLLTAVTVEAGDQVTSLTWQRIYKRVPAYLPVLSFNDGPFDKAQTIWEWRSGPFEVVAYGVLDLTTQAMASAIYGFDPTTPPKPAAVPNAVLSARAAALAERGDMAGLSAGWAIVTDLFASGYMDDGMLRVAVQKIRRPDPYPKDKLPLGNFVRALDPPRRARFNDGILRVLTTPAACDWCHLENIDWNDEGLERRATEAFRNTIGLERWQYMGLVKLAGAIVWNGMPVTPPGENRRALAQAAVSSVDTSASARLASFIVAIRSEWLEDEVPALTAAAGRLDPEDLYWVATRGYNAPSTFDQVAKWQKNFERDLFVRQPQWLEFWRTILSRLETIPDAAKRDMATRHANEKLADS